MGSTPHRCLHHKYACEVRARLAHLHRLTNLCRDVRITSHMLNQSYSGKPLARSTPHVKCQNRTVAHPQVLWTTKLEKAELGARLATSGPTEDHDKEKPTHFFACRAMSKDYRANPLWTNGRVYAKHPGQHGYEFAITKTRCDGAPRGHCRQKPLTDNRSKPTCVEQRLG